MRLGIGTTLAHADPEDWARTMADWGCGAAAAPVDCSAEPQRLSAYLAAAKAYDLPIGEVGVWKNTLSPDETQRRQAVRFAQGQLALAEEIGARCCVNITGNAGNGLWDQYSPENDTADTYALIVDTVRAIVDAVHPKRTFYTLECMPWMQPDSPESCLNLLRDVDRPAFGVHLDYTNMVNSMQRWRGLPQFIRACFEKLGPHIKSVHAKDIALQNTLPLCIREVPPGRGGVDFGLVLRLAEALGPDTTVFVEHLNTPGEYRDAVAFLRQTAAQNGIPLRGGRRLS